MPTSLPNEIEQTVARDRSVGAGRRWSPPNEVEDGTRAQIVSPNDTAPRAAESWRGQSNSFDPTVTPAPGGSLLPLVPGYVVTGEIARGGMGVVLAARDVVLGREVAIKTLLPSAALCPVATRRFVTEARITARLSHPGVPPVHALGALAEGRPYLVMKLIRGRTLAAILAARDLRRSACESESAELTALYAPGLLQGFEQICQAVGFAHAQGIIHRDLKPANIMVGTFGEVQVMDWGLAREIVRGPAECERAVSAVEMTPSECAADTGIRVSDDTERSRIGEALGTPAYMSPEQACGDWDRVDARTDVFALGGILCTILTGKPPYTGRTALEVVRRAAAADLDEAFTRLDTCGADPELIKLAKRCLAPNPADRFLDAATVAAILHTNRFRIEEQGRVAETERALVAQKAKETRYRAAALAAAKRVSEERIREATQRAAKVKTQTIRRHWVVTAIVVLSTVVLMKLCQ